MKKDALSLLLDLFDAGIGHAYMSVFDFNSRKGYSYCRIEMVLNNVGRLCLYQTFVDLPDGEQVPQIKVFYTSATNKNLVSLIKSPVLLHRATHIIYKCKKFYENHPETIMNKKSLILEKIQKNESFIKKIYRESRARKYSNLFLPGIEK